MGAPARRASYHRSSASSATSDLDRQRHAKVPQKLPSEHLVGRDRGRPSPIRAAVPSAHGRPRSRPDRDRAGRRACRTAAARSPASSVSSPKTTRRATTRSRCPCRSSSTQSSSRSARRSSSHRASAASPRPSAARRPISRTSTHTSGPSSIPTRSRPARTWRAASSPPPGAASPAWFSGSPERWSPGRRARTPTPRAYAHAAPGGTPTTPTATALDGSRVTRAFARRGRGEAHRQGGRAASCGNRITPRRAAAGPAIGSGGSPAEARPGRTGYGARQAARRLRGEEQVGADLHLGEVHVPAAEVPGTQRFVQGLDARVDDRHRLRHRREAEREPDEGCLDGSEGAAVPRGGRERASEPTDLERGQRGVDPRALDSSSASTAAAGKSVNRPPSPE